MCSLKELAERIGCRKYPERWEGIYDAVMADFDANGCIYTDPEYYVQLNRKYGILEKELETYKAAAVAIGKNEDLSRYLALACAGLQQREFHGQDLRSYTSPKRSDGKPDIAYDMFPGLVIASEADICYELLTSLCLPDDQIDYVMKIPEVGVMEFRNRHNGLPGHSYMEWYQIAIDAKLFRVGRLEFEFPYPYQGSCIVLRNRAGEEIILAHEQKTHRSGRCLGSLYCEEPEGSWIATVKETDTYWEGNPINSKGLTENRLVRLDKTQWTVVLKRGDPVVNLHIPADGPLKDEDVTASIAGIREFLAKYFPNYEYKAFTGHSWIVDPQLCDLLGENANISKFVRRFYPVPKVSKADAVFTWVFNKPDTDFDINDLPENTTLERKIKEHYKAGKAIYEVLGHFY